MTPRPEVQAFAEEMERALRANDHKGGWNSGSVGWLFARLLDEVGELAHQVPGYGFAGDSASETSKLIRAKIVKEAVDVANFCMMIADKVGGLKPKETP